MTTDLRLLRRCFSAAAESDPSLSQRFYEIFFERHPRVKELFEGTPQAEHHAKFNQMLIAVVDHLAVVDELDDEQYLGDALRKLGAQHVRYGVTPEMYPWFSECLCDALRETAGDEWSESCAESWQLAFAAISRMMLDGAGS